MKNKKEKSPVRKTIALAGNPNSGKTTLFNLLTKSHQHIGNWPGVTVERKEGRYFKDTSLKIVDLPGIYSLTPLSVDEEVAHNYINNDRPDLIIDVVDSTNLERNLFLTSQLLELDIPVVVALNMEDEARAKGIGIDGAALEKKRRRWQQIAAEAAGQSGRGRIPEVAPACRWEQAVQALSDDDVRLVTESDGGYVVRFRLLELWDALVQRLS